MVFLLKKCFSYSFFTLIFSFNLCFSQDQDFTLPPAPKKILSLDGGGTRGVWSLEIIQAIEAELEAPITNFVDCFTGASMGGILSLGYAAGYSSDYLMTMILDNKQEIFTPKAAWWNLWGRWTEEKYLTQPIEAVAKRMFGTLTFSDLKKTAIIPASNITKMRPQFFSSYQYENLEEPLWLAARATSAAPTYFEPVNYKGDALVDGALVTNNPALLSSLYLNNIYKERFLSDLSVVSVGTGTYDPGLSYVASRNMGALKWATPISTVLMDMNSIVDDYQMDFLLPSKSYVRLNTEFDREIPLDSVSSSQIESIRLSARTYIRANPNLIKRAVFLLTKGI